MIPKQQPAAMPPPTPPPPPPPPPASAVPKGVSTGGKGEGGKTGGATTGGYGGGGGVGRGPGRRGVPTKFLSILYDMLVEGNPQVWWERETGSVVIEDPQLFEEETMPRFFLDPKVAGFLRQLAFYGFKKPGRSVKEQGRYQHPECRWKDVSCVKFLLTKKAYDLRRLEKAIRNTSAVAGPDGSPSGDGGRTGSVGAVGQGEEGDAAEVERTELEVAAEATVVRGKSVGRQVRKELRQMMSRSQLGCWQVEQTAKLMMKIMRLNAKLAEGLRQCRARGGPPVLRRYNMNNPALAKVRLENARLRRRVRRLEDEAERRGLPLTAG
ncbi:unnamed protein product [Ectocarpus sp. CCAP 1310/34]|nr:unnamed protein product [Ectocarpus sp. CCAP 1310/34]